MAFWGKNIIFNHMERQFKYFNRGDKKKEQVGVVKADSIYIATIKASTRKNLTLEQFNNLFEIEEIKGKKRI